MNSSLTIRYCSSSNIRHNGKRNRLSETHRKYFGTRHLDMCGMLEQQRVSTLSGRHHMQHTWLPVVCGTACASLLTVLVWRLRSAAACLHTPSRCFPTAPAAGQGWVSCARAMLALHTYALPWHCSTTCNTAAGAAVTAALTRLKNKEQGADQGWEPQRLRQEACGQPTSPAVQALETPVVHDRHKSPLGSQQSSPMC